jgi:hypothetical protein
MLIISSSLCRAIEIAVRSSPQKRRQAGQATPASSSVSKSTSSYSLLSVPPSSLKASNSSPHLIDFLVGDDESFVIQTTGSQPGEKLNLLFGRNVC